MNVNKLPSTAAVAVQIANRRRRKRIPVIVWISLVWLGLVVVLVLLQAILPLPDPNTTDYDSVRTQPFTSWAHPLGTDKLGRDMLSRVIAGAAVSLSVGLGATGLSFVLGMLLGISAGYFGGIWDRIVSWLNDILLAFPMIIALIALAAFMGPSLGTLILGMGVIAMPLVARLARASTLSYSQFDFVAAAKTIGSGSARILWREIVPNVSMVVVPFAITMVALAITAEGALSFLGLGVPPPQASWGSIMNEGRADMRTLPYLVFIPAFVMCVTLLAISFIADWVNRLVDSRESKI